MGAELIHSEMDELLNRQPDIKQLTAALHDLCEHVLQEFRRNSHDILKSTALIFR